MIPFGPRMGQVFASRWKALLWAAGVMLTAYCTIPDKDQSEAASSVAASSASSNPWGK
jgi:hypothetical protein